MIRNIHQVLIRIETWFAASSLLLLIILSVLQVLARNFYDTGILSADILTRYLVLYVTFFGAALAVSRNRHLTIDACAALLTADQRKAIYRPVRAVAAIVCGFFTMAAIRFWLDEWQYATDAERWQVLVGLVIPIGFLMLTIEFLFASWLGAPKEHKEQPE